MKYRPFLELSLFEFHRQIPEFLVCFFPRNQFVLQR